MYKCCDTHDTENNDHVNHNETKCMGGMCIIRTADSTTGLPHGMQWNGMIGAFFHMVG